ncbi:hypothetical protein, partial [Candidatus Bandiella numerosa]|uniref:hypothetical protein n=1 Tax=Candidatus Bandiella numerosa TaxID=2570586 RepID=UPI001F1A5BD6
TLPSASFRQLLTKLTLPQLMDSSISAHEGLEPSTLTSCTAHTANIFLTFPINDRVCCNPQGDLNFIRHFSFLRVG